MKTIFPISNDIYFNLAWEEYILKEIAKDEDIFLLWQNNTAICVGRNQNVYEEVNLRYVHKNKIPLVRRISGGGTVFHDLGNLNYTFITKSKDHINNYKKMTQPIVDALNKIGIPIEFSGKSDLKIRGKKVSGNAQFVYKDLILHHGTLLFDSNLEFLQGSLKEKDDSTESISVKSNRSVVTNIADYTELSLDQFKQYLLEEITQNETIALSKKDFSKIEKLKDEKYVTYNWNYGESPRSVIKKKTETYDVKISVVYGMVEDALILVDGSLAMSLASSMVGVKFHPTDLGFLKAKHEALYSLLFE
ncbi:lipoate--protein ligase family protein [Acholeplasma equirhinis]|uniref:lipoate--protein ligase family protein n=1 Tax=Acholeplasma equirhinis TaxID=555393 RepID=UPI00197A7A4B|nr:biotin/lipoate A/B protein ligase family protein [Acholeplasma equirhinis]MBN3491114.1 lipoate--protein ligase family protein [Acholeplasma equirhinis]